MFRSSFLALLSVSLLALPLAAANVSGHWEGTLQAGDKSIDVTFDLSLNANGEPIGTITVPAMHVDGLPLSNLAIHDDEVVFDVKGLEGGTFRGKVDAAGKALDGEFTASEGGMKMPYHLTRNGDARIAAKPRSAAVGKEFAGEWTGVLKDAGGPKRVGLRLINDPDGTSRGIVIASDGTEIPIRTITQSGSKLTLDVRMVAGAFEGTLGGDGTIAGAWTQGKYVAPLAFSRLSPLDRWANAIGGREKIASVRALYREATVEAAGASGTIKVWHTANGAYRKEENVGSFSSVETFDGTNGMVQQGSAPPRRMSQAEADVATSKAYANSNAIFFAFDPQRKGTVEIDPDGTIVMKPAGGIDWHVTLDPKTSLPATMVHSEGGRAVTVALVSYETVEGMRFENELRRTTGDPHFNAVIRFTKTVINPPIDPSLFTF